MEYLLIILQTVLTFAMGIVTMVINKKYDRMEKREAEAEAKKQKNEEEHKRLIRATRANLKFQIFRSWQYHTRNGYLPPEEIDIQNELYETYKELGGNGTGELYHNEMLNLPHTQPEEKGTA